MLAAFTGLEVSPHQATPVRQGAQVSGQLRNKAGICGIEVVQENSGGLSAGVAQQHTLDSQLAVLHGQKAFAVYLRGESGGWSEVQGAAHVAPSPGLTVPSSPAAWLPGLLPVNSEFVGGSSVEYMLGTG